MRTAAAFAMALAAVVATDWLSDQIDVLFWIETPLKLLAVCGAATAARRLVG